MKTCCNVLFSLLSLSMVCCSLYAQAYRDPNLTYDQQLAIAEARIAEISLILSEYNQEIVDNNSLIATYNNRLSELQSDRQEEDERLIQEQANLEEAQRDLVAATIYFESAQARFSVATNSVAELSVPLDDANRQISEYNVEIEELYACCNDIYDNAYNCENQYFELDDNPEMAAGMREEAAYYESIARELEQVRDRLIESIGQTYRDLERAEAELESTIQDLEAIESLIAEYSATRDRAQASVDAIVATLERLDGEIQSVSESEEMAEDAIQRSLEGWASAHVDLLEIEEWLAETAPLQ